MTPPSSLTTYFLDDYYDSLCYLDGIIKCEDEKIDYPEGSFMHLRQMVQRAMNVVGDELENEQGDPDYQWNTKALVSVALRLSKRMKAYPVLDSQHHYQKLDETPKGYQIMPDNAKEKWFEVAEQTDELILVLKMEAKAAEKPQSELTDEPIIYSFAANQRLPE